MLKPKAIINLNNFKSNIDYIKSLSKSSSLLPVIKADAYGHGLIKIAKFLNNELIDGVCVATCDEIIKLIEIDFKQDIFHLGRISLEHPGLLNRNIIFTINSLDDIQYINNRCKDNKYKIRCHIKVDTGMNRMGCRPSDLENILLEAKKSIFINLEGIYSHLSCADNKHFFQNNNQIKLFENIITSISSYNLKFHLLNSSGIMNFPKYKYDFIRSGLALYGISPIGIEDNNLLSVMTFIAPVALIKEIKKGDYVGYGCTYKAKKNIRIAIVQCGYADGIPLDFSNKAYVFFDKHKFPIIGKVSMDLICVDISKLDNKIEVKEFIIWGGDHPDSHIEKIAEKFNTIPYSFLTSLSNRVERIYIEE